MALLTFKILLFIVSKNILINITVVQLIIIKHNISIEVRNQNIIELLILK